MVCPKHSPNSDSDQVKPLYSCEQVKLIRKIYLLGIFFWILVVISLKIFPTDSLIEFLILLIPIVLFLIAWKSVPEISDHVENFMFTANLLTLGLLIAFPILTWVYRKSKLNRTLFLAILGTAIIFSVLALFNIWVPHKYLPLVKHIKSILQTYALALFIFALYRFFVERRKRDDLKILNGSPDEGPEGTEGPERFESPVGLEGFKEQNS